MIINLINVIFQSLDLMLRWLREALRGARRAHDLRILKIGQGVLILHAETIGLLLRWRILTHKDDLTVFWNILKVPNKFAIHGIERLECLLSFVDVLRAQLNNF